jgi:hypothetical protein
MHTMIDAKLMAMLKLLAALTAFEFQRRTGLPLSGGQGGIA